MATPTPQEFKDFIADHFSFADVDGFCADYFRAVYDDFHGTGITRSAYIREVVTYCQRRDQLDQLAAALQKKLPDLYAKKFPPAPVAEAPARAHDARRVFVSHSTKDAEFAHRLADDLRKNGFDAWIAPDCIQPGEKWVEAIERGLTESGIFLALLTPNAVKSKWVKSETHLAIELEKGDHIRIMTLMLEKCEIAALSKFLTEFQYISFENSYPLDRLLAALRRTQFPLSHGKEIRQHPKTIWLREPLEMQFMRVDAGEFLMGSDKTKDPDIYYWELPEHKVYLDEYYMGKTPVTNAQYAVYAEAKGIPFSIPNGKGQHPVVNVDWNDANVFCAWLNKAQNKYQIALPTEAQWEKAARGTDGRIYPWGDQKPDVTLCNFNQNEGGTTAVGKYSPQGDSPYECADMVGNVLEWCADYWDVNAYATRKYSVIRNPIGPATGMDHVVRGGSFWNLRHVRCAWRDGNVVDNFLNSYFGFRVVLRLNTSVL